MKQLFLILLATSAAAGAAFTDNLYRIMVEDSPSRNIIASPISVELILSMIYMGAKGRTADELEKALVLPRDKREVASIYKSLSNIIDEHIEAVTLDVANRVYVSEVYTINTTYNDLVEDAFEARATRISFSNRTTAAEQINAFVMDRTHGKDKDCFAPSDIMFDDKVILVNAIYFKGQWRTGFDPKKTHKMMFTLSNGISRYVQMMETTGLFRIKSGEYGQVLELPFANSKLSMFIILPWVHDGLEELEDEIPTFSRNLPKRRIRVHLPKFKIEFREPLTNPFQRLGIRDLFTDAADLSDLLDQTSTKVSKVHHHAVLEIDENGAEASTSRTSDDWFDESFIANVPFAFEIRDKSTIYFKGRFVDPETQA